MWFSLLLARSAKAAGIFVERGRAHPADAGELVGMATRYVGHLIAGDFDEAGALMDDDIVFEDPTADAVNGVGVRILGRADVLDAFEDLSGVVDLGAWEITTAYVVGRRVVLHVEQRVEAGGGVQRREYVVPGTLVLEFSASGSIVRHLDLVDYPTLFAALGAEGAAP